MRATCHACIGGTNVWNEMQKLQAEAIHIVVGTPGRVFDMLNRRYLSPKWIKMIVLDEADEMLSWGFKDQIYEIFQKLNTSIQVVLLSATMPADVLEVTKKFMRDPIPILVKKEELTLEGISFILMLKERNGSWIHFVTCMRHWQLHRLLFFSIQSAKGTGSQRKCMPGTSQFLPW